jgi:segregation and condensation protein B
LISKTKNTAPDDATDSVRRSVEALLFVAGEALSIYQLARLTQASEIDVAAALQKIAQEYADRGIVLREIAGGYRFATSPLARTAVEAYLGLPKTPLSRAAMETLAIIVYVQPVTRSDLEALRGVDVDGVVSTLLKCGFIAEAGRREIPGRPILYQTTLLFLQAFGLYSLEDLPPADIDAFLSL